MEKSRCHAVAHGGGCAGSAKSHKSGGRCGQGRGA
ncbi:antitoxin, partial [Mycobacterium tuberculosis]|nr:antitoxin [Mycobacterium tuberculosis]